MKALITGGTGFVGSHVARVLAENGHGLRILHRRTSKLKALAGLVYESAIGDVTELDALRKASEGCDWVFHVAAVADYWRADEAFMFKVNVDGTRKVLQAAREARVKRVVFTSSAAAVGLRDDGLPADESILFNLPPHQFPYGYSKALAEEIVAEAVEAGQDVVIVNPAIIIGPGDLNLISGTFIIETKRLQWLTPYTSGGVSVIDVRDVAHAHLAAAEKGRTGERYILTAANYPNRVWMAMIAKAVGVSAPRLMMPDFVLEPVAKVVDKLKRHGLELPVDAHQVRLGSRNLFFNASKMYRELGRPQISMPQSLDDTYEWYLTHGYIQPDILSGLIGMVGKWLNWS